LAAKKRAAPLRAARTLIDPSYEPISVARQCELLEVPRSTWYYRPQGESAENLVLMRLLDEHYTRTPFYGIRRMTAWLRQQGYAINPKRVSRLLRLMGVEAIYPKPHLSRPGATAQRYPYLLRDLTIKQANHVWSSDITFVRMRRGFLYLVAILDWYSRYVLSWELSNTLDGVFCLAALEEALAQAQPEIFNTDQGAQFTSLAFTTRLAAASIRTSWGGRGRALDNVNAPAPLAFGEV
jgi:putative transposase